MIATSDSHAVLFVDDSISRKNFAVNFIPRAFITGDCEDAIKILQQFEFGRCPHDLVMLDFDLGPGLTTEPIARYLAATKFPGRVISHSENPWGWQLLSHILPSLVLKPFPVLRREIQQTWETSGLKIS